MGLEDHKIELLKLVTLILKIIFLLFLLKVVAKALGFVGYIPIADEIFNFIMKMILSIGGNPNVLPHGL